jgi:SAM-dependent methyltransferase
VCGRSFPLREGVPDFREKNGYWGNVGKEKMQNLNTLARESGDWLNATRKILPEYAHHFEHLCYADAQFLWPVTNEARVLDAGSMWGRFTIPVAQYHHEVYAVDKTIETLEFLSIRAKQLGLNNIKTIASDLKKLPFPDKYFDVVVLNGVLEWVAFDDELILENKWQSGKGLKAEAKVRYTENPEVSQLKVLKEINRVMKHDAILHFAIENRVGYIYLAGSPDNHMNLPFVCFLPRLIANVITKFMLGCEYRTYVYTPIGYKSMLLKTGFFPGTFYGAFRHYINPSKLIPFKLIEYLKWRIFADTRGLHRLLAKMIPKSILSFFSPSIVAIASKGKRPVSLEPRIVQLLKKTGVVKVENRDIEIVQCDSRPGNYNTANFWIYGKDKKIPICFCKICRSKSSRGIIISEAENMKIVNTLLKGSEIECCVPKLYYSGTVDGITFMVTEFMDGGRLKQDSGYTIVDGISSLDSGIRQAIRFLSVFQKNTEKRKVDLFDSVQNLVDEVRMKLSEKDELTSSIDSSLASLLKEVDRFSGISVPVCGQHGDFDYFYNMLFSNNTARVIDFEHFLPEELPFMDIVSLILNPLLTSKEYRELKYPLSSLIELDNIGKYLRGWLKAYMEQTETPLSLLPYIIPLAAVQQKKNTYPLSRDPADFPVYRAFAELLKVRLI